MPRKPTEWPEPGELVIGSISRVNPFSAFVVLGEYPGKEGMVHISEVARKWIKDIRDFVKEGETVVALVLNVDTAKGHIGLSLKRVSEHEAGEKLKEYKREAKAEKMLAAAAKKMGVGLDEAYRQVGFKLRADFGELFKGFQTAVANEQLLLKKDIPANWVAAMKDVGQKSLEVKEAELKVDLELRCPAPDGVEVIRKALGDVAAKWGLSVRYVSAPKYSLVLKTKNAKSGEKQLAEAAEAAVGAVRSAGGEGDFKPG